MNNSIENNTSPIALRTDKVYYRVASRPKNHQFYVKIYFNLISNNLYNDNNALGVQINAFSNKLFEF